LYYLEQDFADFNSVAFTSSWPPIDPTSNLCITQVDNGDITTPGHTAISIPNSAITSTYDPITTVWQVCFKVDSFSYFYCHTCNPLNAALPVSLLSFTANQKEFSTDLKWVTSSEFHNQYFIVERSQDGKSFSAISEPIPSKGINGNSLIQLSYFFEDSSPNYGHNYYRLKQVDIDGKISYSHIVNIYFGNENAVNIYPNPVKTDLNIDLHVAKSTQVNAQIFDATGRVIRSEYWNLAEGDNKRSIDIRSIAEGMYLIRISNSKGFNYSNTFRKN